MSRKSNHFPLILELLALGLLVLALILPRAAALGRFVTPDEYKWIARSANFYKALSDHDFASTFKSGHPGVTVMWAGTLGFLYKSPEYIDLQTGQVNSDDFHLFMDGKQISVTPLELLRDSRFVMVILNVIVLAVSYLYARRLLGTLPALAGFLLIAFDPFHVGLTRLLHLDGLMGNFILLAILAFLAYLYQEHIIHVVVSGIAAALGFLTRSPAIALVPVIGLLALSKPWKAFRQHELSLTVIWQTLLPVLIWLAVIVITIFAVWPAIWVRPLQTITQVFTIAEDYAVGGHDNAIFFNGQVIPSGDLGWRFFYFYPLTYLWRATPVVVFGLAFALWGYLTRRKPFDTPQARLTVHGLILLVVIYTLLMTLGGKKFDRYLLPVYPALDIIAGLGWFAIAWLLWQKRWHGILHYSPMLILIIAFSMQIVAAIRTFPYYLSYYNPLFGGSRKAPQVMQIGWGEGLDQAALYLNSKPNAKQIRVSTFYPTGCFSYFFDGKDHLIEYTPDITSEAWERFTGADYAVIYISQWQRQLPKPVLDYVTQLTPEHTIWINGLEYARIYKLP
jgi:hypothetical protein